MKKLLILCFMLIYGMTVHAEFITIETDVNMDNYWAKEGKDTQKVLTIAHKIMHDNKLPKRMNVLLLSGKDNVGACAHYSDKSIYIYNGLLPYIDSDDELAFVLSHEMTHDMDYYDGPLKLVTMTFNSKEYETKADLNGIDMMVQAGYNPLAAICVMNKVSNEAVWDNWFLFPHPKGSTRLLNMYKYIYKKYPWAFDTDMVKNVNYKNFTFTAEDEINDFHNKEKQRSNKYEDL